MSIYAPLYKVIPLASMTYESKFIFKYLPKQNHYNKKFVPDLSYGKRPWLMNEMDITSIVQISGSQMLELYNPNSKKADFFTIKPTILYKNGKIRYNGQYLIEIAPSVFFRFIVSNGGSSSVSPICYDMIEKNKYSDMYKYEPSSPVNVMSEEWMIYKNKKLNIDDLPDYDLDVNPALISKWEQAFPKIN